MTEDFHWNEAELGHNDPLNRGLVSLVAFDRDHSPYPIGTGFIIAAFGAEAVACTAAHNLRTIQRIQDPYPRHHPTALREFLPAGKPLNVDRDAVRALHFDGQPEMAVLGWAVSDETSDLAFFSLRAQDTSNTKVFQWELQLTSTIPAVREEIAILGYRHMAASEAPDAESTLRRLNMQRELVLRRGRVAEYHADGHRLCHGPCIETTVPVFPGMSGAPVMPLGSAGAAMTPFGLVCSDPDHENTDKWDRSKPGSSIVSLIMPRVELDAASGQRKTILLLHNALRLTDPKLGP